MIDIKIYFIVKSVVLIGFLAYFSYEDIRERKISNKMVAVMAAVGLILAVITMSPDIIIKSIICGGAAGALAFLTELLSHGGLGRGDVLVIAALGVYIGDFSILIIIFISLIVLCLFCIAGMLLKKINMKSKLPYIPFLLIGVIIGSLI